MIEVKADKLQAVLNYLQLQIRAIEKENVILEGRVRHLEALQLEKQKPLTFDEMNELMSKLRR